MLIRSVPISAILLLGCSGCAMMNSRPAADRAAATDASYMYKGDITRDGGTTCWYYCF